MEMLKIAFHLLMLEIVCKTSGASSSRVHILPQDRNLILKLHNDFRRSVGASNMMELTWDQKAAKAAADWGGWCVKNARPGNEWAQNMNQFSEAEKEIFSPVKIIRDSFKEWSKELKLYDHPNTEYKSCGMNHTCSYVQLLKAEIHGIGCALMNCPDLNSVNDFVPNSQLFVCFYTPRINRMVKSLYLEGKPCSACRAGTKCINKLCAESRDTNLTMQVTNEASRIHMNFGNDRRLETLGQQSNVTLLDRIKETDGNREGTVSKYANVVIPFPGSVEHRDVRLLARMERRRNRQHFEHLHNSNLWKKTNEHEQLFEQMSKQPIDKASSVIRKKRQTDEYLRRRNEELRRMRDRKDQERDEARRREYDRRLQLYLREVEIREQRIREQQQREESRLRRERLRNIIESTDGLNEQEQYFTIAAHNLYRRQERLKDLTWSNWLERWAKYVIRCDREYPGPITCYTNFGKSIKEKDIYNVVYEWASEGPFQNSIRLETGCRTPSDKTVCNHNTVIQNPDISEMACASMDCGSKRQLTCIYH